MNKLNFDVAFIGANRPEEKTIFLSKSTRTGNRKTSLEFKHGWDNPGGLALISIRSSSNPDPKFSWYRGARIISSRHFSQWSRGKSRYLGLKSCGGTPWSQKVQILEIKSDPWPVLEPTWCQDCRDCRSIRISRPCLLKFSKWFFYIIVFDWLVLGTTLKNFALEAWFNG